MVWAQARVVGGLAAASVLAGLLAGCGSGDETPAARKAATAYLAAWSAGDDARAARLTDRPAVAQAALTDVRTSLEVRAVSAKLGTVTKPKDGSASARVDVRLALAGLGDWTYSARLRLHKVGDGNNAKWMVAWSPADVHPDLSATTRLARTRELPARAPILGRDGQPLMSERPVVDIGIEPRRLSDPQRAYAALAGLDVDTKALAGRVAAAKPDNFVPVITLRREEFATSEARLRAIPGLVFRNGTRTLAPTATFARGVLGSVHQATKESLSQAGPLATAADDIGDSGLEQAFQAQLAGTPSGSVRLVQRSNGSTVQVLHQFEGKPGEPLRITLDPRMQRAAETALAQAKSPAALVAIRPSTGEVLAAADAPADSSFNRAFVGHYAPGSTFKVVSATALVSKGLRPSDPVPCPESVTIEGKKFVNYDALGSLGTVPFERDFAMSCNTAFIGATRSLPRTGLHDAAALYGLGRKWDVGVPAFSGSVPTAASAVEQAADTIGQGKVVVSPLGMAVVAAGVESGTPRLPVLVVSRSAAPLPALPGQVGGTVRSLMLLTAKTGTAKVIDLPGTPVGGKTGTAEYGTSNPPRKHAW
ncbi:MAG TPA: penicillin-binding transpeptidase domain-containing protein, partial [Candidatus Eisenbacteria bacterium]|nr:penicillin-binding transpeptidase domain-containing protein [Candidatus Eisenbacteria bacterium]